MATTLIKFRQGTGTPVVGNATNGNSIGEPLWSTDLKKLYVTNGTENPVLIGPGPDITVTPEYTVEDGGPLLATIAINESPFLIYAPANTGGGTSTPQTLNVANSNGTNPTLITLTGTNSIELRSSTTNTNVTTVIAGEPAGADANGKAKLLFDVQINTIDGGTWNTTNG